MHDSLKLFTGPITDHEREVMDHTYPFYDIATATTPTSSVNGQFSDFEDEDHMIFSGPITSKERSYVGHLQSIYSLDRIRTNAATIIQSCYRRHVLRQSLIRHSLHKRSAAVKIQSFVRMRLKRVGYCNFRKAVVRVQSTWKMILLSRHYDMLCMYTICLQSLWRMKIQRRRFKAMKMSVLVLQNWWRSRRDCRKLSKLRVATITIQSLWRGLVERRRVALIKQMQELARAKLISCEATRIQSWLKMKIQRNCFIHTKAATSSIQSWWRTRREVNRYTLKHAAATRIQTFMRMKLIEIAYRDMRVSVVQIQSWWRWCKARARKRIELSDSDSDEFEEVEEMIEQTKIQSTSPARMFSQNSFVEVASLMQAPTNQTDENTNPSKNISVLSLKQKKALLASIQAQRSALQIQLADSTNNLHLHQPISSNLTRLSSLRILTHSALPLPTITIQRSSCISPTSLVNRSFSPSFNRCSSTALTRPTPSTPHFYSCETELTLERRTQENTITNSGYKCGLDIQTIRKRCNRPESPKRGFKNPTIIKKSPLSQPTDSINQLHEPDTSDKPFGIRWRDEISSTQDTQILAIPTDDEKLRLKHALVGEGCMRRNRGVFDEVMCRAEMQRIQIPVQFFVYQNDVNQNSKLQHKLK